MPTELKTVEEIYEVIEEAQKKPSSDSTGKGKTFAVSPDGYVAHLEIECKAASLIKNMDTLLTGLKEDGWTPHGGWGVSAPVQNDPNAEKCPDCGTAMVIKQGIGRKTNKPYKCWSCPKNKNHPPIWINDDDDGAY